MKEKYIFDRRHKMKRIESRNFLLVYLIIVLVTGCTHYPVIQEPDSQMFSQTVHSPALRDSLRNGKLTAGMPYFVVNQLFNNYSDGLEDIKIPVATLGSKQRLEEEEGWGRKYVDPNIKVFLDQYETSRGKLYVWYQRPDFYTMDVSSRDTLCVFLNDTPMCTMIDYLKKSSVLTVRDSLPDIPIGESIYAEVHYNEPVLREISYWYNLQLLKKSGGKSFLIKNVNYESYPIELIEFDGEPVSSFKWREVNKNEN